MTCACIPYTLRCMEKKTVLQCKKFPKKLLIKLNIAKAKTGRTIGAIVAEAVQDWMKKK